MRLVTSEGMQRIDRRAQEEYGIPGLVLMESAGLRGGRRCGPALAPPPRGSASSRARGTTAATRS